MQFDPRNHVVQLCVQGLELEGQDKSDEAGRLFMRAWDEATDDSERFIAAHFVATSQTEVRPKLEWLERALEIAQRTNDLTVHSALPSLHTTIAKCYESLGDIARAKEHYAAAASANVPTDRGPFYHGTRADLKIGDLLTPGGKSNYKSELVMNHIYFTALVNGAGLAAALAKGDSPERVYIVEPLGDFENDPNVTDKKFPGNPTRSYRTTSPLKIVGEVTEWARQSPEDIQRWRERLAKSEGEIIN
jgi:rifampin ADP-ribosylating transferase